MCYIPCCWLGYGLVPGTTSADSWAVALVGRALTGSPAGCCASNSALTWVRMSSKRSVNASPLGNCWGSAGVVSEGGSRWAAGAAVTVVLADIEARVERRTAAVEWPADRLVVVEERRFADLGMFTGWWGTRKLCRKLENFSS